ncbi:hypothetical protein ACLOJK_023718 [Asimina triloba]
MPSAEEPTDACCDPLKAMIKNDLTCLCEVFNNDQLLNTFGVKQKDALKVPKACGESVDIKKCESSSDGEEASSLPPEVALAFEAFKEGAEQRRVERAAAAAGPASGPSASSDNSSDPSAPTTSTPSAVDESKPSADADSPSGGSNSSSATRSFAQGFGVLVLSGVASMALLN